MGEVTRGELVLMAALGGFDRATGAKRIVVRQRWRGVSMLAVVLAVLLTAAGPVILSPPARAQTVTDFPLPRSPLPESIALGSDNALWFTEGLGNKIGRVTPA